VTEVESLKLKIQSLERSQGRYRQKAEGKAEKLRDVKVELEEARNQAIEMEEKVEEMRESMRVLERYRRWWLTEYHSLQALIGLIPDRRDVEAIASSADERFRWHYATL
jgi:chromosome segregation ATPase